MEALLWFISKWLFIYNNQSHQPCSLGKLRGSVLQSSYFQCSSNRMSLEHRSAHRQNWNDHILLELFKQIFCVNISLVFHYQPYLCKNIWVKFLKRGFEMLTIVDSRAVITFHNIQKCHFKPHFWIISPTSAKVIDEKLKKSI